MDEVLDAAPPAAPSTAIAEYSATVAGLADLKRRYAGVAWDCTTSKGDRDARSVRKELVTLRTSLDKLRLQLNADDQARIKNRNDIAKDIIAEIEALEEPVKVAIKAEEDRRAAEVARRAEQERLRIDTLQRRIAEITGMAVVGATESAAAIEQRMVALRALTIGDDWQEFQPHAAQAWLDTLAALCRLHAAAEEREAEAARVAAERAELARLRAEQEARDKAETARQAEAARIERERLAAERAEYERELEAFRAQQREAEAKAKAEREELHRKVAAERAEADRLAQEARDAEQRRIDAERAAQERAATEKRAAEAKAAAEQFAAEQAALREQIRARQQVIDAADQMLDVLVAWRNADEADDADALEIARVNRDIAIAAAMV